MWTARVCNYYNWNDCLAHCRNWQVWGYINNLLIYIPWRKEPKLLFEPLWGQWVMNLTSPLSWVRGEGTFSSCKLIAVQCTPHSWFIRVYLCYFCLKAGSHGIWLGTWCLSEDDLELVIFLTYLRDHKDHQSVQPIISHEGHIKSWGLLTLSSQCIA